jgi:hypothetical protein
MKVYRESRGIAPLILNLSIGRRFQVNFTLPSLYLARKPRYLMGRRLGGPLNQFRRRK